MSATIPILSHSRQNKLNQLFRSRLRLVLSALVFEILIMILLTRTLLFVVGLFNMPAIIGLVACVFQGKLLNSEYQKTAKTLLKVGIAKAIGGILLAGYMGLKCTFMLHGADSSKATMKLWAIYLGGSAIIDILYSIFALMVIKRTKDIIRILRVTSYKSRTSPAYTLKSPSRSCSGSSVCSDEDTCDKSSQSSL